MRILRRKLVLVVILLYMMATLFALPFQDIHFGSAFLLGIMFACGAAVICISRFLWLWSLSRSPIKPINIRGRTRYWVESDEKLLVASIKIILCTDAGFSVSIADQAFAKEGKKVVLTVMRMTRVDNRDDKFIVRLISAADCGTLMSEERYFENVNDAVDEFIAVWKNWQIGEEWIDIRSPKFTMFSSLK